MKIILACEGKTEVCLINSLIEKEILCFHADVINEGPCVLRQLDKIKPLISILPIDEDIYVFRIGDTLKDKMNLNGFEMRTEHIRFIKICTKPEIEILVIIQNKLVDEYRKSKFYGNPKQFLKDKKIEFDPNKYFCNTNAIDSIYKYRTIKKHKKEEFYLADLIDWCKENKY